MYLILDTPMCLSELGVEPPHVLIFPPDVSVDSVLLQVPLLLSAAILSTAFQFASPLADHLQSFRQQLKS